MTPSQPVSGETPRTDAKLIYIAGYHYVSPDFARSLERELSAERLKRQQAEHERDCILESLAACQRDLRECAELLEWSRKYVYHHQRPGDQKGLQFGQVPVVYPEDMAKIDALLARLKETP